jgi:uncharacterized membrane protein
VTPRALLWAGIAAYAAGFAALANLRHLAFETGRFDLGNMVQAVWSTAHGDPLAVTNLAGEQTVRLESHVDPILAAFAPLWLVWPHPSLLLTVQAIAISLGAVPVFWLARKHLGSDRPALGFALAYLLYPATQWLTLSEFHAVALACPLLLLAFWFLDEDRLAAFAAAAAVAVTTKEEVGLVVAAMGVWYAIDRRRWALGGAIALAGVAATLVAVEILVPVFGDGGDSSFYSRYEQVGGSPLGLVETAFRDPGRTLSKAFDSAGVEYLAELVLPLALIPVLAPVALVVALPELALNLLSSTRTQTSIHYHYTGALIPGLVAASVLGAGWIVRRRPAWRDGLGVLAAASALGANVVLGAIPVWSHVPAGDDLAARLTEVSEHDRTTARVLAQVPDDAVVSASNSLGAHLSERRRFLSFPIRGDATWIAVDRTRPGYLDRIAPQAYERAIDVLARDPRWRLVRAEDGVLLFRRRGR